MPVTSADASPRRIVARASSVLAAAGALDPTPLRIDCAHVNTASISITYAENPVPGGGSPSMIVEVFNGLTWVRATIDNVGSLTVKAAGTASPVNAYVKEFPVAAAIADEFAIILGKRFYAFRVNFFERVTPLTPGTLACAVVLGTE